MTVANNNLVENMSTHCAPSCPRNCSKMETNDLLSSISLVAQTHGRRGEKSSITYSRFFFCLPRIAWLKERKISWKKPLFRGGFKLPFLFLKWELYYELSNWMQCCLYTWLPFFQSNFFQIRIFIFISFQFQSKTKN